MKPFQRLTQAFALTALFSVGVLSAHAANIPISDTLEADELVAKVVSVDPAKHLVVLEGEGGHQVSVQLSDKAKNLANLKAGDQVNVLVTRSIAVALDTDVDTSPPGSAAAGGVARSAKGSPNPGGEAYRQIRVELKITHIDLKTHQVTLEGPQGRSKVVTVENPKLQARMKNLKVDQSVWVTYTDTLQVTTQH
jgi:predicted RNA-binding protein